MDVCFAVRDLVALDQEVKKSRKLFGIPIVPLAEDYNEAMAKEAESKLRVVLNDYSTPLMQVMARPRRC
jgi:hypothetical protein